jgi:hypothetical protein
MCVPPVLHPLLRAAATNPMACHGDAACGLRGGCAHCSWGWAAAGRDYANHTLPAGGATHASSHYCDHRWALCSSCRKRLHIYHISWRPCLRMLSKSQHICSAHASTQSMTAGRHAADVIICQGVVSTAGRHTPSACSHADGIRTDAAGPLTDCHSDWIEDLGIALDHCAQPQHIGLLLGFMLIVHDTEPGAEISVLVYAHQTQICERGSVGRQTVRTVACYNQAMSNHGQHDSTRASAPTN